MGIDTNTICRWVRDAASTMPSYAEEKGIVHKALQTEGELLYRIKELEKELEKHDKKLAAAAEKEKVKILKTPAHFYATTRMKREAIYAHSSKFSVRKMCRALGLCEAPYYQ